MFASADWGIKQYDQLNKVGIDKQIVCVSVSRRWQGNAASGRIRPMAESARIVRIGSLVETDSMIDSTSEDKLAVLYVFYARASLSNNRFRFRFRFCTILHVG